jgi:Caspase domain
MKYIEAILYAVFFSALILLSGCVTTEQIIPKPSTPSPGGGEARIMVSRPADDSGCDWIIVYGNGKKIGSVGCGGSLIWDQPLGKITLTARNFGGDTSPYIFHATESKTYNLYISSRHFRILKTFSSEIYPSVLDKSDSKKAKVKNGQISADVDSISKVKALRQLEKWGLIIGISNYKDTQIPKLRYSVADAKAFYDWCISPDGGKYSPSRVKILLDQEATARNIRNALFVWLRQALEEDMVTIYFAGHGSSESPDSNTNLFLLPYDVNYNDVASTGFPMWDIETALRRFVKAKKVVVIADACHSGGIGQAFDVARRTNRAIKVNPISSGLQNLSKIGDGVCVISASDEKQLSQESQNWGGGHGVFTYFLLKGLEGEADYNNDNRVTLGELIPFLSEKVRRETSNSQSPVVAGKFDPALSIGK